MGSLVRRPNNHSNKGVQSRFRGGSLNGGDGGGGGAVAAGPVNQSGRHHPANGRSWGATCMDWANVVIFLAACTLVLYEFQSDLRLSDWSSSSSVSKEAVVTTQLNYAGLLVGGGIPATTTATTTTRLPSSQSAATKSRVTTSTESSSLADYATSILHNVILGGGSSESTDARPQNLPNSKYQVDDIVDDVDSADPGLYDHEFDGEAEFAIDQLETTLDLPEDGQVPDDEQQQDDEEDEHDPPSKLIRRSASSSSSSNSVNQGPARLAQDRAKATVTTTTAQARPIPKTANTIIAANGNNSNNMIKTATLPQSRPKTTTAQSAALLKGTIAAAATTTKTTTTTTKETPTMKTTTKVRLPPPPAPKQSPLPPLTTTGQNAALPKGTIAAAATTTTKTKITTTTTAKETPTTKMATKVGLPLPPAPKQSPLSPSSSSPRQPPPLKLKGSLPAAAATTPKEVTKVTTKTTATNSTTTSSPTTNSTTNKGVATTTIPAVKANPQVRSEVKAVAAKAPPLPRPIANTNNDNITNEEELSVYALSGYFKEYPFYGYNSQEELEARSMRFPSFDQRVRTYMGAWYVPPCDYAEEFFIQYEYRNTTIEYNHRGNNPHIAPPHYLIQESAREIGKPKRTYYVDGQLIRDRGNPNFNVLVYLDRSQITKCQALYNQCESDVQTFFPAMDRLTAAGEVENFPLLLQYGDTEMAKSFNVEKLVVENYPNIPVIKKFRLAYQPNDLIKMTSIECNEGTMFHAKNAHGWGKFQPILWKQKIKRHYGMLDKIPKMDLPWEEKKNMVVFRGAMTGIMSGEMTAEVMKSGTDYDKCMHIARCRLVYTTASSPLVDALLTDEHLVVPEYIGDVRIYGDRMVYKDILEYKAIIMPQGNDVSTGIKWAMFSNSVVMFPPPDKTSWPMEELMVPWVHYIPLSKDFSDVEEKMQWIIDHDDQARRIAHAGSLWIRDLVIHPDAEDEERRIYDEIIRRFRKHFKPAAMKIDLPSPSFQKVLAS